MTVSRLIRLSGLAGIGGGIFIILARVFQVLLFGSLPLSVQAASDLFVPALGIPGLLGSLGFLIGLAGLYLRQAKQTGIVGLIVFSLAFTGIALSFGANWGYAFMAPYLASQNPGLLDASFTDPNWGVLGTGFLLSYLAGGLSWLLVGITTLLARVLPGWVGLAIIVSIILVAVAPVETTGPGGILVNALLSAGPIAAGFALWAEKAAGEDIPVPGAAGA